MYGVVMQAWAFETLMRHAFFRVRRVNTLRYTKGAEISLLDEFPPPGDVYLFEVGARVEAVGKGLTSNFPSLVLIAVNITLSRAVSSCIASFAASFSTNSSLTVFSVACLAKCRSKVWVIRVPFGVDVSGSIFCEGDAWFKT